MPYQVQSIIIFPLGKSTANKYKVARIVTQGVICSLFIQSLQQHFRMNRKTPLTVYHYALKQVFSSLGVKKSEPFCSAKAIYAFNVIFEMKPNLKHFRLVYIWLLG